MRFQMSQPRWMQRKFVSGLIVGVIAFSLGLTGCTPQRSSSKPGERVVKLAIWSNYLSPEILSEFHKKTGIRVLVSHYSSNEELLAKLQAGASGYDVVVPSDYMVFVMSQLGLLREIDSSKLSHLKSLDRKFLGKSFDPKNRFSVPYDWGTTGIAVNRKLYSGELQGWKDVFDKKPLEGRFSLLDDARETMGAALKALGFSLNSKNPAELDAAKKLLIRNRPHVKSFTSEPLMPLSQGESAVAHAYVSDAMQARQVTGGKVDYVIPVEGCTLWIDNLVIPSGSDHLAEAHEFINFLLEAKTNVSTELSVWVSPANQDALALLPVSIRSNRSMFPTDSMLAKCEMIQDLGETLSVWERIWTEVKAQVR